MPSRYRAVREDKSLRASAPQLDRRLDAWALAFDNPNTPSCGLEFDAAPGKHSGKVAPDGGCPGNFYTSRRWAMEGGTLTISNELNEPLAQFKLAGNNSKANPLPEFR